MRYRPSLGLAAAILSALTACSSPEPSATFTYDPYVGDAYPNRRPNIEIPEGGLGIVSDSLSDSLSLLDLATGERLGQVRVDPNPGDIVLSQDGSRLVVSHFDLQRAIANPSNIEAARATLAVIDPEAVLLSGSAIPKRLPICIAPHGVALSKPDGARAFVACYGEDALAVADLNDPSAPVKRIPMGRRRGATLPGLRGRLEEAGAGPPARSRIPRDDRFGRGGGLSGRIDPRHA